MAADSAAIAAVDVNCLRETVRVESSRMRESSVGTGSHTATGSPCYTGSDAPVAAVSTVAPLGLRVYAVDLRQRRVVDLHSERGFDASR